MDVSHQLVSPLLQSEGRDALIMLKKGMQMKVAGLIVVGLVPVVGMALTRSEVEMIIDERMPKPLPPPQPVTVQETVIQLPDPKYSLWDGVDVAIRTVVGRGEPLSVGRVLKEVDAMAARNEIGLPYSYSLTGGGFSMRSTGRRTKTRVQPQKRYLDPVNMKAKETFESQVARRVAFVLSKKPDLARGQDVSALVNDYPHEPSPRQFTKKEDFAKAYAAYKMKNAGEDVRTRYAKKIGGMDEYRRDMQREAMLLWNEWSRANPAGKGTAARR